MLCVWMTGHRSITVQYRYLEGVEVREDHIKVDQVTAYAWFVLFSFLIVFSFFRFDWYFGRFLLISSFAFYLSISYISCRFGRVRFVSFRHFFFLFFPFDIFSFDGFSSVPFPLPSCRSPTFLPFLFLRLPCLSFHTSFFSFHFNCTQLTFVILSHSHQRHGLQH